MGREWTRVRETAWARTRNLVQLRVPGRTTVLIMEQFPLILRLGVGGTMHKSHEVPET